MFRITKSLVRLKFIVPLRLDPLISINHLRLYSKNKGDKGDVVAENKDEIDAKKEEQEDTPIKDAKNIRNDVAKEDVVDKVKEKPKAKIGRKAALKPSTQSQVQLFESKAVQKMQVPDDLSSILAIPLTRRPLFPGFYKSMHIKDPKVIIAIQDLVKNNMPFIGIFLAKNQDTDQDLVTSVDEIERVGVFAQITNTYLTGPDNSGLTVVVYPHRRIRITALSAPSSGPDADKAGQVIISNTPDNMHERLNRLAIPVASVENLIDEPFNADNRIIKATTSEVINMLKEISQSNPLLRDQIITVSVQTGNLLLDPSKLADFAAAISAGEPAELQEVLESLVVEERLHKSLIVLKKELANAKLQQEISQEVDKKINRKNQEYFLMEQLKGIKKELGLESDGKEKMIENFKTKAAALVMPEHVKTVFDEEIRKLSSLEPQASEFNVTRNYLDWLTQIPWGKRSEENFDIQKARLVLDEDHFGLKDVKDRILEFIAVGKLRGSVQGKIITLVGPPGVGKTSVGKSIARALGREFFRFSVGGLTDVAEIKGHRRTYVGAMPGKVIQALKKVKTENPLIMIDEVDKIGTGHRGDPASALLELLDPEQNDSFLDHYMDVPIDLSQVLFVCTANTLDTIPGPLVDRMEVITLSGYVEEEKVVIASKYLAPQSLDACGLKDHNVELQQSAVESLIKNYCRENGVRNLKKRIDQIYRKVAFKIVQDSIDQKVNEEIVISATNIKDFVGAPIFHSDRMYESTPPGVVMGLAWTSMGGSTLYIESVLDSVIKEDSKPSFHRTGQMGDVMKESSTIAYTFAKSFMAKRFPEMQFFDNASLHMHVPEGATPKDGPSAGCTMTTSLLSLAVNQAVMPNVAMTGEITLTGKILKIGGLKEKAIAAKRSGVKTIIFPFSNRTDWDELPDYLKKDLDPHFVSWYDEIFDIVFSKIK